jgi:dTDP-4-amino-4,6-dideoxygalactose transaminase
MAGWEKVRVCPLTYAATYAGVANERIPIEWVDCDFEGWPAGPVDIGVELWGRPFVVSGSELPTILDSAHRFAADYHKEVLEEGKVKAVVYSFNCQKEVAGIHGGAIISPHLTDEWRTWMFCGTKDRVPIKPGGIKGYLQQPLAYIINKQLIHHKRRMNARRRVLEGYHEYLGNFLMTLPGLASGHLAVVRLPDEGHMLLVKHVLERNSIEWSTHYAVNPDTNCRGAIELSKRIVSVPCHARMTPADGRRIARIITLA